MSIFPFYDENVEKENKLELFKEYAYDFEKNEFKLRNGKEYLVSGDEALKIWIHKALITDRFKFIAYDDDYGSEINTLIGISGSSDIINLELKRMITETLMVNPYIVELSDFNVTNEGSKKIISFKVSTIYDGFTFEKRWDSE